MKERERERERVRRRKRWVVPRSWPLFFESPLDTLLMHLNSSSERISVPLFLNLNSLSAFKETAEDGRMPNIRTFITPEEIGQYMPRTVSAERCREVRWAPQGLSAYYVLFTIFLFKWKCARLLHRDIAFIDLLLWTKRKGMLGGQEMVLMKKGWVGGEILVG